MAQFVLKIEKLSHIMGPRGSQDLQSPSPIMAPGRNQFRLLEIFFRLSFFTLSFLFAAVIDLLLGLLAVKKLLRKLHRDGQIFVRSSKV